MTDQPNTALTPDAMLQTALDDLLTEHERLLEITRRHRDAISVADLDTMRKCTTEQNVIARQLARIERRRVSALAACAQQPRPQNAAPRSPGKAVTVRQIADELPEPRRAALLDVAKRLKDVVQTLRREQSVIGDAATSLASHMHGLVRQISDRLSHTGTYGRSGAAESRHQVLTALDVTS